MSHEIIFCAVVFFMVHVIIKPVTFTRYSLLLRQSHHCPVTSEINLKYMYMGKTNHIMLTSSKWKHFRRCWPFVRGIHGHPAQRPVTRSFDVFSDLHPNKRFSKQSWGWWFMTPSRSLWRHCNVTQQNKTRTVCIIFGAYFIAVSSFPFHHHIVFFSIIITLKLLPYICGFPIS